MQRLIAVSTILILLNGCQKTQDPQSAESAPEPTPIPQVASTTQPIVIGEGELWNYRPGIANVSQFPGGLVFKLNSGKLPPGCLLDAATGGLSWTPTETDGPGSYRLEFSCHPAGESTDTATYHVEVTVTETNVPPRLNVPPQATVKSGSTFEQPIDVSDDDFPANRISLELQSGPKGAVVDDIAKLLYWEIPTDWQEPLVEFTITARDDGTPPMNTTHTLVVTVTDMMVPKPKEPETPESQDRIPEVAIELPPLPRPGESIETVPLDLELDPPLPADDVRLSLMVPYELRSLLKMRYIGDDDRKLAILLTDPFKADDVPGNLSEGIVATCVFDGTKYAWTWAMTKDLTARGYQNNLRHAVLAIESKRGGTPRLVALQKVVEVPAPTLDAMLANDRMRTSLTRHDRVKKSIALEGLKCTAENGDWKVNLESQIDGFSLYLTSPDLTQRVNTGARANGVQFTEFGFRVLPSAKEISIGLDAKPSPAEAAKSQRAARQTLLSNQRNLAKWRAKLAGAENALSAARRLPEKNRIQRLAKGQRINKASLEIQRAQVQVATQVGSLPGNQNLVATMDAKWEAMVAQLEPVRFCVVSGELWRRVGDVRVPVLRLVPVEADVAAAAANP